MGENDVAKATRKPKIYRVTVVGEYFKTGSQSRDKELHPYREVVRMDEEHKRSGFLYVWKNLFAPQWMPPRYPGYEGLLTHNLESVVDESDPDAVPNDVRLMNLPQLIAFVQVNDLPVDIELYADEDALKQAVIDCLEDEESFVIGQEKRQTSRGHNVELKQSLADLNPGLQGGLLTKASEIGSEIDLDRVPDLDEVVIPNQRTLANPSTKPIEFNESDLKGSDEDEKPVSSSKTKAGAKASSKSKPKGRAKSSFDESDEDDDEF